MSLRISKLTYSVWGPTLGSDVVLLEDITASLNLNAVTVFMGASGAGAYLS